MMEWTQPSAASSSSSPPPSVPVPGVDVLPSKDEQTRHLVTSGWKPAGSLTTSRRMSRNNNPPSGGLPNGLVVGGGGKQWVSVQSSHHKRRWLGSNPQLLQQMEEDTSSRPPTEQTAASKAPPMIQEEKSGAWSVDPEGDFTFWWSVIVSVAFVYNLWVIAYRCCFTDITDDTRIFWFPLDYSMDFIYLIDICIAFRTGFLEDGVLQTEPQRMRAHYMNSTKFYIDCLCLLPLDILYLSMQKPNSAVRCFRLVKIYKFWQFSDRVERHTNYPNAMRTLKLVHYIICIAHWNACLMKLVSDRQPKSSGNGTSTSEEDVTGFRPIYGSKRLTSWHIPACNESHLCYLYALYRSSLTLTLMGDLPVPDTLEQHIFVLCEMLFALLMFATVLGHVGSIVVNVSVARKEFQGRLDNVKSYLIQRRVSTDLQLKVIKWFDYLWTTNKITDEEKVLSALPDKLKAEIAIRVHLDTLKRVDIFQDTEEGFLSELVLRLRPVLSSPGDFVCRKGEVGKEMYVVNRGRLHVMAEDGHSVLATLRPGSYFGEISILNMGTAGNRRTASVISVGYSDLFCLSKDDLWEVLKEYPIARGHLEAVAAKRLSQFKKKPTDEDGTPATSNRPASSPGNTETLNVPSSRTHGSISDSGEHCVGPRAATASGHAFHPSTSAFVHSPSCFHQNRTSHTRPLTPVQQCSALCRSVCQSCLEMTAIRSSNTNVVPSWSPAAPPPTAHHNAHSNLVSISRLGTSGLLSPPPSPTPLQEDCLLQPQSNSSLNSKPLSKQNPERRSSQCEDASLYRNNQYSPQPPQPSSFINESNSKEENLLRQEIVRLRSRIESLEEDNTRLQQSLVVLRDKGKYPAPPHWEVAPSTSPVPPRVRYPPSVDTLLGNVCDHGDKRESSL